MKRIIAVLVLAATVAAPALAQKIGYVDSEYIISKVPEAATVQQQIDRVAQQWQDEVTKKQSEVDRLFKEFQARELLYTSEERQRRRDDIIRAEEEVSQLRQQYFGPQGQLFSQQETLMRPVQEKILTAIEEVAKDDGYDYVFDKAGEVMFMYTREQFNLSDKVLLELGIDVDNPNRQSTSGNRN